MTDRIVRERRLASIDGLPPVLMEKPEYCPFAPRCSFAVERCWKENPQLNGGSSDHKVACWVDTSTRSKNK